MRCLTLIVLFSFSAAAADNSATIPRLLLANNFHQNIALDEYWVSEKYDGVRAYWNGKQLVSRNGHAFAAPEWFTRDFPVEPLDGELWLQRGSFEQLSSIVRTDNVQNNDWQNIHYMVFDAPAYPHSFDKRLQYLKDMLDKNSSGHIRLVHQWKVENLQQLQQQLDDVVKHGGEGLMLHRGSSFYSGERSDDLLKLKPFEDAEATVVKHIAGNGKYSNMMGSIEVINNKNTRFRIGTGFNDNERKNPPPVGTIITYRFNGLTRKGLPRFPRFMRIRNEW